MAIELYRDKNHICLMLEDLVGERLAVQANQFMIATDDHLMILDPGGNMTYNGIYMCRHKYFPKASIDYVAASHADPDIVASLNKWLVQTQCKIIVPQLWMRFVPHFCTTEVPPERVIPIPDTGMTIQLGNSAIKAIPAHFLHSEGNFQFYDPISKILFSGDMGASMVNHQTIAQPVTDFEAHLPTMKGFHQRYMSSNKVCRYWVNMVRKLDIEWIVPQHGRFFKGKPMVNRFLDWIEQLQCGVDLVTQDTYRVP